MVPVLHQSSSFASESLPQTTNCSIVLPCPDASVQSHPYTAAPWGRRERIRAKHCWSHTKCFCTCYCLKCWHTGMGQILLLLFHTWATFCPLRASVTCQRGVSQNSCPWHLSSALTESSLNLLELPSTALAPFPLSCRHCCSSLVLSQHCSMELHKLGLLAHLQTQLLIP